MIRSRKIMFGRFVTSNTDTSQLRRGNSSAQSFQQIYQCNAQGSAFGMPVCAVELSSDKTVYQNETKVRRVVLLLAYGAELAVKMPEWAEVTRENFKEEGR